MKRILLYIIFIFICSDVYAADLTSRTETTSTSDIDIMYLMKNPSSTKDDRKITIGNLRTSMFGTYTGSDNISTVGTITNGTWSANTITTSKGGTGLTTALDDYIMLGDGSGWQQKMIPDCDDLLGKHLNYDTATNSISCGNATNNQSTTVAGLGAAIAYSGNSYFVTDGSSTTDCTVGGGSNVVLCRSNGSTWVQYGGGSGSDNLGNHVATQALEMSIYSIDGNASTGIQFKPNNTTINAAFNASGYLGIGTTDPTAGLHIANAATTEISFRIKGIASQSAAYQTIDSSSGSGDIFRINANGYVGIGTSAPTEKLHISSGNLLIGGTISTTGSGDSVFGVTEQASAPTTPASGYLYIWSKTDHTLHTVDSTGTDTDLTAAGGGGSGVTLGQYSNLIISYGSATTATIAADSVILYDSSNLGKVYNSVSKTCTITTSGIGGLEASDSESSDTWYEIYLKGKSDGTINCLMNSSTGSIGTAPSGYSYGKLLGYVRNDSSSNFIEFYQVGNSVFKNDGDILSSGTATSFTDIVFSTYAPPNTSELRLGVYQGVTAKITYIRRNGSNYTSGDTLSYNEAGAFRNVFYVPCDSNRTVEYKVSSGGSTNIGIEGYRLNL